MVANEKIAGAVERHARDLVRGQLAQAHHDGAAPAGRNLQYIVAFVIGHIQVAGAILRNLKRSLRAHFSRADYAGHSRRKGCQRRIGHSI